jgi:hypothetical protein
MGKIFDKICLKCKTLNQQINAVFNMGSELEDQMNGNIENMNYHITNVHDDVSKIEKDVQNLYSADNKIRENVADNKSVSIR